MIGILSSIAMTYPNNDHGNFSLRYRVVLNRQSVLIVKIAKLSFILNFIRLAMRYSNKSINNLLL